MRSVLDNVSLAPLTPYPIGWGGSAAAEQLGYDD